MENPNKLFGQLNIFVLGARSQMTFHGNLYINMLYKMESESQSNFNLTGLKMGTGLTNWSIMWVFSIEKS